MTAGSNSNINVRFGAQGVNHVIAAMQRVRASAERVGTPMVADLQRLRQVAGVMGQIGTAAAGISAVGIGAAVGSIAGARGIAGGVAEELTAMRNAAKGMGVEMTSEMGAVAFAAQQVAGWEGIEEILGAGGAIMEQALEVKNDNEEVIAAWRTLGMEYSDFFELAADGSGEFSGKLRGIDEIIINMSNRLGDMSKDDLFEKLIPLFGASDGAKIAALMSAENSELVQQIELYRELTGMRQSDVDASVLYRQSLTANEASLLGLRTAFTRDLFPVLTQSNAEFQRFATENQGRMEDLGGVFADFVDEIEPLLIKAAELVLQVAAGEDLDDTPLARFVSSTSELVGELRDGLIDVLEYLTTGQTDVEWIESTAEFLRNLRNSVSDLVSEVRQFSESAQPFLSFLDEMLSMLGVENTFSQIAVVSGLLLFSRTIASTIGLVGTLISGVAKLGVAAGSAVLSAGGAGAGAGAAAAGGAAVAATAGAGVALLAGSAWINKSTADMQKETEQAAAKAKQLAKTHGQAYAAAYLRAFVDQAPETKSGFSAANWLGGKLGLSDLEGTKAELDVIIAGGDASDAIAGAAEAFRDFGWEVRRDGQIEISAGITVSALELDAVAQAQLGRMQDTLRIDAAAAGLADRASIPTPNYSAPSDVGAAQQRVPVLIQIGAGQPISGLSADNEDALRQFSRAASQSARARS